MTVKTRERSGLQKHIATGMTLRIDVEQMVGGTGESSGHKRRLPP